MKFFKNRIPFLVGILAVAFWEVFWEVCDERTC